MKALAHPHTDGDVVRYNLNGWYTWNSFQYFSIYPILKILSQKEYDRTEYYLGYTGNVSVGLSLSLAHPVSPRKKNILEKWRMRDPVHIHVVVDGIR